MATKSKYDRILSLYAQLAAGDYVSKELSAKEFGVSERTIQRDISDIKAFFKNNTLSIGAGQDVIYDIAHAGYHLEQTDDTSFTNSEILAVCKILLESRSLVREEMEPIIRKLVKRCVPEQNQKNVDKLIRNELFHYIEPHHGVKFVEWLWDIGEAIRQQRVMEVEYFRLKDKQTVRRRIQPVGIMVSEYYFYLTAFIADIDKQEHFDNPGDLFPTIYRIDRIRNFTITDEHFRLPYEDFYKEGEFRRRIQFMYGGKLQKIKFKYTGLSIEAVLDRLPTAVVLEEKCGESGEMEYIVEAEVFGSGIEMWVRSQGEGVSVL